MAEIMIQVFILHLLSDDDNDDVVTENKAEKICCLYT